MTRPKSRGGTRALNTNIDATIANELTINTKETGIPKSTIVEKALRDYFEKNNKELEALKYVKYKQTDETHRYWYH